MSDQKLTTPTNAASTIKDAAVDALRKSFKGSLLRPGSDGYDTARKIWNGMFDRHPALIAQCVGPEDVAQAIRFGREHNLKLAVRSGGHSFPGFSMCDDGLVIDLSKNRHVQVDAAARRARVDAGATWGDLDQATQAHELAVTGGQISHTGVAGLTLGGGMGNLMRKYGLTCDSLISADLVTADGQMITASADENADLFWGLRGGGGNFGVVTSFEFKLHELPTPIYGGLVAYPLAEAKRVLQGHREFMAGAPDEVATTAAFMTSPDGHPAVGILICYAGDPATGEEVCRPLRSLGTVVMEQLGPIPYTVVQSLLDAAMAHGQRYYMRSSYLDEISDDAIETLAAHYAKVPSPMTAMVIISMGGAISRVDSDATAFPYRNAAYTYSAFSTWTNPAEDEKNINWLRGMWQDLQPYLGKGVYVNELADEGEDRVKAAYGAAYSRLAALKQRYDPDNVFRLNQNIKPASS